MKKQHKPLKLRLISPLLVIMMLLTVGSALACDWCNNKFFVELNTTRKNTLMSKELLSAIHSQNDFDKLRETARLVTGEEINEEKSSLPEPVQSNSIPEFPPRTTGTDFSSIMARDNSLRTTPTSFIPQNTVPDKKIRISLSEGEVYLGNGVMYKGFVIDGTIPGPTVIVEEGDVVSFTVVNNGTIPHGASIHAAYTQTSKYLGKIAPGDSATVVFKANHPGVYLYHCAPGGHAIPMHIIYGQYGMMVVQPKKKYKLEEELGRKPDIEIYMAQHEYYSSGKDAVTGQGQPMYTAFNGKLFRYVEEPIKAKPGDYVRINYINIGPNLVSTFHIVGIIWDYVYWQGHPENVMVGGQSVTSGPTDSWVLEFRVPPDEGTYTILSHAVGSTDRGAIGLLIADYGNESDKVVDSQGIYHNAEELAELSAQSIRRISPFEPGTEDVDVPVKYGSETEEVIVRIIGNSYYPKIIDIKPGTKVTWINEDVFSYLQGEFSGIHNVVGIKGPTQFAGPLLAHGETYSYVFEEIGEYNYICAPHPYMKAIVRVSEPTQGRNAGFSSGGVGNGFSFVAMILAFMALVFAAITFFVPAKPK